MKRILIILTAWLMALPLLAGPARPGGRVYTQPDGSQLEIFLHGDEWGHWATDREGRLLDLDADGFYRLSTRSLSSVRRNITARARQQRRLSGKRNTDQDGRTVGTHKVLVILVEFADRSFSIAAPKTSFSNMLGQKGYDISGSTGSVWDYFNDNSQGLYHPVFDVYGPVKLSRSMASYGKNDPETDRDSFPGPELALYEACTLLDESIDFSQYDEDGDGQVDMILYYYAGYDEAEGGPANAIWSHQWDVQASSDAKARNATFDGVKLGPYFCTSELQSNSGAKMCNIGATVHEFSHYLGLPDFYDTDGEQNGLATGPDYFSVMSYGLYNNESRTPPNMNADELMMLDWMDESHLQELPDGEVTLESIRNRAAYTVSTSVEGEYFLLECRDASGWDAPLPEGLVIYHVDRSERLVFENYTACMLWDHWRATNILNAYGDHPCFYVIPSSSPASLNFGGYPSEMIFPGANNVSAYQPIDWEGILTSKMVSGIRYAGGQVTLTVRSDVGENINGLVTDTSGHPLEGVRVSVSPAGVTSTTDADGAFFIHLADYAGDPVVEVAFSKEGYVSKTLVLELSPEGNNLNVMLLKEGEAEVTELAKFDRSAQLMSYSATGTSLMGAVRFTAEELAPYEGQRLTTVTFYPVIYHADAVVVLVEIGGERVLNYTVPDPVYAGWNIVDISQFDIRIPAGEPVYIGYAVKGGDYDHPLSCRASTSEPTESYYAVYSNTPVDWQPMRKYDLALSATVSEVQVPTSLADIGVHSIYVGKERYAAGDHFPLRLVESPSNKPSSIQWFFDDAEVTASSVVLASGWHTVEARLAYEDGRTEVLEVEIEVR
ncbi:MAG: M6 family metalloprotease domain-containing protein [Bacteroidales bacterium]|nr:M6 family metalloprotease domain-containing protein [Bacteroidales bacterium]